MSQPDTTAAALGGAVPYSSFQTLGHVFAQAPIGIAVLEGAALRYSFANPRYQQIIGDRDTVGKRVVEMFPELLGSAIEAIIQRVFETGVPFVATDLLIRFDSYGTGPLDNYYDLSYHRLLSNEGSPHGVLVIAVDVTLRQESQAQALVLAATESARVRAEAGLAQLEAVFRGAPSYLAVYEGPTHVFTLANEAYFQLIGHGRDIIGKPLLDALPEVRGQGFDVLLDGVYRTGQPFATREIPVRLRRTPDAAQEHRVVSLTYLPLVDGSGARIGVIAHGTDVTDYVTARGAAERLLGESERARAEADTDRHLADEARAEAESANRAKGNFLAVMSHELRTPLNAIGGYTELLAMGIRGPITSAQHEDLRRIQVSQRHLLRLIEQLLNQAQIDSEHQTYNLEPVPVVQAMLIAEALVIPQLRARGIGYTTHPSDPGLTVHADPDKLQQILLNLLTNAIKFTETGGSVSMSCHADAEVVSIAVTDTGIGIAADQFAVIFEPFVQVDMKTTRVKDGVGLGLAISRRFARGMGGDVTVQSTQGTGSVFTIALPVSSPGASPVS